jgi:hypothetical protein
MKNFTDARQMRRSPAVWTRGQSPLEKEDKIVGLIAECKHALRRIPLSCKSAKNALPYPIGDDIVYEAIYLCNTAESCRDHVRDILINLVTESLLPEKSSDLGSQKFTNPKSLEDLERMVGEKIKTAILNWLTEEWEYDDDVHDFPSYTPFIDRCRKEFKPHVEQALNLIKLKCREFCHVNGITGAPELLVDQAPQRRHLEPSTAMSFEKRRG